jgi:ATP/maltotriose-dependent transcriptional regulator MalT
MDFRSVQRDNRSPSPTRGSNAVGLDVSRVSSSVVATKVRIPQMPSMPLDRLDGQLDAAWGHRLGLVVAPAGSGKTTLLARFAMRAPGPVGWYRAESWDRDEEALVSHLEAALAPALEGVDGDWGSVVDAANALAAWPGAPVLLVIDDLHTLEETPAEAALERFISYAPSSLTVVIASRVPPHFNLSRLRVSGALLELSGDDLRFRSWEVERLFRDFYERAHARRAEAAAGRARFQLTPDRRLPDPQRARSAAGRHAPLPR